MRVEWNKKDRYGRIVGKVWVVPPDSPCRANPDCPMTLDVGLAQITMGRAWWYRRYANEQSPEDRSRYEFAEQQAKAKKVGLWRDPNPVPPWEWRRQARQQRPRRTGLHSHRYFPAAVRSTP